MRYFVLSVFGLTLIGTAFAQGQGHQGPYYSLGGYGNVVYPGTGHAPVNPPSGFTGARFAGGGPGIAQHPQHRRSAVVLYPVYYGAGAYDPAYYGDQSQAQGGDPNGTPSVVINQGFVPPQGNPVVREYSPDQAPDQASGMRLYQNPSHPFADPSTNTAAVRRPADDDQPTLYLIAFKDHSIVQALGYWMEGGALHYVSVEQTLNQVSLDLIDRDLSQRLNDERGVQFKLPAR